MKPSYIHVLTDLGDLVTESFLNSAFAFIRESLKSFHIVTVCCQSHVGQLFNELYEFFVLGHEVCLRVYFHYCGFLIIIRESDLNQPLCCYSAGFFGRLSQAFFSQKFDSLIDIAVGFH